MDPFTLIAAATTAFNALKKGIEIGKRYYQHGVAAWVMGYGRGRLWISLPTKQQAHLGINQ